MTTFEPKARIEAGEYWLVDPCLVIPRERWITFCRAAFDKKVGVENDFGLEYLWIKLPEGTEKADVQHGESVCTCKVESGILALVSKELMSKWGVPKNLEKVATLLTLNSKTVINLNTPTTIGEYKIQ